MFCPNCRTEYRQGITVCADCGAKLVEQLTPDVDDRDLMTVLETGDLAVVALAKSMLEEAGIDYAVKGELPMQQLSVGPVEIQVDKDHEAEASELLADLVVGKLPADAQEDDDEDETEGIDEILGAGHHGDDIEDEKAMSKKTRTISVAAAAGENKNISEL